MSPLVSPNAANAPAQPPVTTAGNARPAPGSTASAPATPGISAVGSAPQAPAKLSREAEQLNALLTNSNFKRLGPEVSSAVFSYALKHPDAIGPILTQLGKLTRPDFDQLEQMYKEPCRDTPQLKQWLREKPTRELFYQK